MLQVEKDDSMSTTIPIAQNAHRMRVVEDFLAAGIALNKIDSLRPLLEVNNWSLTDSSHLRQFIPAISKKFQENLKSELTNKKISVIFDGTTKDGEAVAVVIRFLCENFVIKQSLVRFRLLSKSLSGEELATSLRSYASRTSNPA
eukprot:Pompholyxophrys_sp_v1_NODE_68_length_2521_cov_1.980130.p2 type:complete len:145 gc:universal NODE_68_length_2521_cov_1.980130:1759-1325(-)